MPHSDSRDCNANSFRYVDWTQNPSPFEPIPPCPSKDLEEEVKKIKLQREKRKKRLQAKADALKSFSFKDLGIEDVEEEEEEEDEKEIDVPKPDKLSDDLDKEEEAAAMEQVWQQELDALDDEGSEYEDEEFWEPVVVKKTVQKKWWQKIFRIPAKESCYDENEAEIVLHEGHKVTCRCPGRLRVDQLEEGPNAEKRLQEKTEGEEKGIQEKTREIQKQQEEVMRGDQEDPETEKNLQKLCVEEKINIFDSETQADQKKIERDAQVTPEGVKRDLRLLPEEMQGETPLSPEKRQEDPDTLAKQKEMKTGTQIIPGETQRDAQTLPEGIQKHLQSLPEGVQGNTQALPEGMPRDVTALHEGPQETQKDAQTLAEGLQKHSQSLPQALTDEMPRDVTALPEGAQGDGQVLSAEMQTPAQVLPASTPAENADALTKAEEMQRGAQALSEGAQGDGQVLPERMQSKDVKLLSDKSLKSNQSLTGQQKDNAELKAGQKRKTTTFSETDARRSKIQIEEEINKLHDDGIGVPAKKPTLLHKDPWKPGDIDPKTKKLQDIDDMWFEVQTARFMPQPDNSLAPYWRWHTPLTIYHYILKAVNPFDTLFSGLYTKERHGAYRGGAVWRRGGGGGWGCGCPGLPCICHLHSKKSPKQIPNGRSWCMGGARSRLMERVAMRTRVEERLHEKLAKLPPPHTFTTEPLFCLGLSKCLIKEAMTKPMIEAAERSRREAMKRERTRARAVQQFPCDPACRARCVIAYANTVKMLRLQAAEEMLDVPQDKQRRSSAFNIKFTDTKADMQWRGRQRRRKRPGRRTVRTPAPTTNIMFAPGIRYLKRKAGGRGRAGRSAGAAGPSAVTAGPCNHTAPPHYTPQS